MTATRPGHLAIYALLCGACAAAGLMRPGLPRAAPPGGGKAEPLAAARHDYREEHGAGRIVAEVELRLERRGEDRVELLLAPSALGPLVEPIAGLRGVRGGNHRTALDLERLLAQGSLAVRTRPLGEAQGAARAGRVGQGRRGVLPERRLGQDGAPERRASDALSVVAVELASGPVEAGEWTVEVVAGGRARLAVDFSFDGEEGELLAVRTASPDPQP
jgi:hypothetical protein